VSTVPNPLSSRAELTYEAVPERDLFANFDRMRRDMDELFGDMLERTGLTRRRLGFLPAVDVAYTADPPRAIVTAELAGVDMDSLDIEIQGRKLLLSGKRDSSAVEGDVYQQVEIERGSFRRVIELGADVRADEAKARYEEGMLRIELPLVRSELVSRSVPIESGELHS
jgi:HSP20 family protein